MARETKAQRAVALLEARGWHETKSTSDKYRKFAKVGQDSYYWVGRNGALRHGVTVTSSYSCTDMLKHAAIAAAKPA